MVYNRKTKKYTISDIAKEIGVSKTTVSRAINNKSDILPETREKILKLIKKHNYQPSALAKGMISKKNDTLGIVIPHDIDYVLMNPFYDEIIRGIVKEADKLGYFILLLYCNNKNYLDVIYQNRLDGLLVISPGSNHRQIVRDIEQTQIPTVLTSRMPEVTSIPHVCVNDYKGARIATEHLISLGHKKVGFINGPSILASSQDRMRGYQDALKAANLPFNPDYVVEGANTLETGYSTMKKLLKTVTPTAVFIAGDFMAFGAMNAIHEENLHIPKDISLVGFDGIPIARVINPPLTTVNQSILEKGRCCVRTLVDLISGKNIPMTTELDVELIIRKTTGPVK